ncbi:MAG: Ig-like domain-containing protein [Saccharospirillum sp.]
METFYTAEGCIGSDVVTATITVGSFQRVLATTIDIAPIDIGTIESSQPSPSTIALKGFGSDSLPSTTRVTFTVKNKQGNPVSGQEVRFSILKNLAGIELTRSSGTSNSEGQVTAIAQGGTINTVFTVLAETDIVDDDGNVTETISTHSKPISVNTGLPNGKGFGVATDTFNPWGWNRINTEAGITVTAGDFHNGPVRNGTVVTFVTSGGQIQFAGSEVASCEITEGDCSVKWESGPPYPSTGGTVVMAHTKGEEAFVDVNGNSMYDIGESFTALAEPYLDTNQNSAYDAGEYFVDVNGNGVWNDVPATPKFRGASCSAAAIADGHCAELAYLFSSVPMVMSSASVTFDQTPAGTVDVSSNPQTIQVEMSDVNGNIPALGTSVAFSCLGDVEINGSRPDAVPNAYILGAGYNWSITITSPDDPADGDGSDGESDTCFMEVDTVDGGFSSFTINVVY